MKIKHTKGKKGDAPSAACVQPVCYWVFILVGVVLMLGVLELHVLPGDIRNMVLHLGLVPGFELGRVK